MRLIVTGGCGFLGSNLAADAIARGDEVTVFDNLRRTGAADNLRWLREQGRFDFVHGDVRHAGELDALVAARRPDAVFHLAGQVAMTTSIADPVLDFETNARGTLNLLEAVRRHAPEAAVLYSSTNKVYGDLEQFRYRETDTRYVCADRPRGFAEDVPLDFHSPYGCSKGAADQYMLDYARIFGLRTVVFRHSSMYGGRQFATFDQGWIGWFCGRALEARRDPGTGPFTISGSGKQVRDLLHARDMVRLYREATAAIDRIRGRAFNIGGGMDNSLSLLELFAWLERRLDVHLDYRRLPPRESDQRVFVADTGAITGALGWRPRVGWEEGLETMLEWLEGHPAGGPARAAGTGSAAPAAPPDRRPRPDRPPPPARAR